MKRGRNFALALVVPAYDGSIENSFGCTNSAASSRFLAVIEGADERNLALDLVNQDDFRQLLLDRHQLNFPSLGNRAVLFRPRKIARDPQSLSFERMVE